jgi:hypothetical protein
MSHILKVSVWQSGDGKHWYLGDIENLGHNSGAWWHIPRMLDIPLEDYPKYLKDKGATNISYNIDANVLHFAFTDYNKINKMKLEINALARKKRFVIQ